MSYSRNTLKEVKMKVRKSLKDIGRATHVFNVLFRHGLGYFIEKFGLKLHLPFSKRLAIHKYKKPEAPEIRLRKAFEELGATYIKLGQMLSLRPDLIPKEYCDEFAKLQDKVPPFSFEKVKQIVERELGASLGKLFKEFDRKPLGSASIGQVHTAKLKNGEQVVVKVLRPKVNELFREDIDLMYYFAKKLEGTKNFGRYSLLEIVKEFERYTKNELNYLIEARSVEKFYANLKKEKYVKVPKVYMGYTTDKVLTLEFIKGEKLSDLLRGHKKFNKEKVMNAIINSCLKQVFEQNVFHGDLHPGNILVTKNNNIALLDFGIVGSLTPYMRKEGMRLYIALINKDIEWVVRQILRLGKPTPETDMESFRRDVDDIVSGWHGTELRHIRVTHMLRRLFESSANHNIKLPVDMILLGKALVTVEGTCLMLNPQFNFVKHSYKYVSKYSKQKAFTKENLNLFMVKSREIGEVLEMIPSEILAVLEKLRTGVIKIDVDDTDLKRLALGIDKSSNRLAYSLIVAALIVGGALMMHANVGPYYRGLSFPAMVLYIIAAFMGLMLLGSIIKEGTIWR